MDGGYIVYLGTASASSLEQAQFKAEGQALEDLANECSLVPKGTRIEDRYTEHDKYEYSAYVKLAVEFQDCDHAAKALEPAQIREVANVSFTEQLKRYQDLTETGVLPPKDEVAQIEPPDELTPAPTRAPDWNDQAHFYVVRQYVAYQKQIVILSPPTAYAPNSPASKTFAANLQPATQQIETMQKQAPTLKNAVWTQMRDRPYLARPAALAPRGAQPNHALNAPAHLKPQNPRHAQKDKRRRHRH